MKLQTILIIVFCLSVITAKEKLHKKSSKKHHKQADNMSSPQINGQFASNGYEPKHISETFYGGNPNTLPADRGFLWKGYGKKQFSTPYYHGVVGPQWRVPRNEAENKYTHISSPHPEADFSHRIIADDLPDRTHSHNSFEMPKRRDVVQIDIPYSSTHTRQRYWDARLPDKGPVDEVSGTQYHGTKSANAVHNFANNSVATAAGPQTKDSMYSFAEKKNKKSNLKKGKKWTILKNTDVKDIKTNAVREAVDAEDRAYKLLYNMTPHPELGDGSMALGIDVKNKRDLAFGLHHNNRAKSRYIDYLKTKEQGVRTMNIKPFMPPVHRDNTRVTPRN